MSGATAEFAAALGLPLTTEEPATPGLEEKVLELNQIKEEDVAIQEAIIEPKPEPNKSLAEEDEEGFVDEELSRITESNRHIPYIDPLVRQRSASLKRRNLLVFTDPPVTERKRDRIIVTSRYGVVNDSPRKRRLYLAACDFSEESLYALEWAMGTMMRDGDSLYVLTVVNREDNPDTVKAAGLSVAKELEKASETLTKEARKILNQMLLFDITLITCAAVGRVKDVLTTQIQQLPLTMVVCGSKGRGTVKGLLMGSISTYLVHISPVPVSVIRLQNKKKNERKKPVKAPPLSESMYNFLFIL
ncbi:hypothetical protein BDB00DRAFT_263284 [Zychaea mexicana]|uniref:uncharacterized protein n=1 Tax=Zychaea mexicana TaxID=64656 RepID=UPI0022FDB7E8|nr:uncharacterized protein BDB00DRAFT_263284 [Zychaea mexicana]KAI9469330.1 hypothetical protein BDB00DRAFT_263284 [Zychaea mexicana]